MGMSWGPPSTLELMVPLCQGPSVCLSVSVNRSFFSLPGPLKPRVSLLFFTLESPTFRSFHVYLGPALPCSPTVLCYAILTLVSCITASVHAVPWAWNASPHLLYPSGLSLNVTSSRDPIFCRTPDHFTLHSVISYSFPQVAYICSSLLFHAFLSL